VVTSVCDDACIARTICAASSGVIGDAPVSRIIGESVNACGSSSPRLAPNAHAGAAAQPGPLHV
jgi:hypothetical protein